MPIIGLTDQGASFPLLGSIRKGSPKQTLNGKEIQGKDLDYFRLDLGKNPNPDIERRWAEAFGPEPKAISVMLLDDEPKDAFDAWYKEYKGNAVLVRKCDGQTQHQWLTPQNTYSFAPKSCQREDGDCNCIKSAELKVMLPDLGVMGFFKLLTHSTWDIVNLSQQLQVIYNSTGTLKGIPYLVRRTNREIFANYNGKKNRVTKSLLSIEVHPNVASRVLKAIEARAFQFMEGGGPVRELPPAPLSLPDSFDSAETVEVEAEFVPPKVFPELKAARTALGWSPERMVSYLQENYQVSDPASLTPEQHKDLLLRLEALQDTLQEIPL